MSIKGRQGVLNNAQWEHTIVIRYQTHCRTSKTSYFCWVNGDGYIETQNGWQNGPSLNQWNTVPCPIIIDTHQKTWFSTRSVVHFLGPLQGRFLLGGKECRSCFSISGALSKRHIFSTSRLVFHSCFLLLILFLSISHYCQWNIPTSVSCFAAFLCQSGWLLVNLTFFFAVNIPINGRQHPHLWQSTSSFLTPFFFVVDIIDILMFTLW